MILPFQALHSTYLVLSRYFSQNTDIWAICTHSGGFFDCHSLGDRRPQMGSKINIVSLHRGARAFIRHFFDPYIFPKDACIFLPCAIYEWHREFGQPCQMAYHTWSSISCEAKSDSIIYVAIIYFPAILATLIQKIVWTITWTYINYVIITWWYYPCTTTSCLMAHISLWAYWWSLRKLSCLHAPGRPAPIA